MIVVYTITESARWQVFTGVLNNSKSEKTLNISLKLCWRSSLQLYSLQISWMKLYQRIFFAIWMKICITNSTWARKLLFWQQISIPTIYLLIWYTHIINDIFFEWRNIILFFARVTAGSYINELSIKQILFIFTLWSLF